MCLVTLGRAFERPPGRSPYKGAAASVAKTWILLSLGLAIVQTFVLQLCRSTTCQDIFGIPTLLFATQFVLYSYLQYQIAYILFLLVLRLLAGIELRVQVDRASSEINNTSELVQRLLRRKRRRTVVVGL